MISERAEIFAALSGKLPNRYHCIYHSYNSQIQYSMLRISPERNCLSPLSAVQSTQKLNR